MVLSKANPRVNPGLLISNKGGRRPALPQQVLHQPFGDVKFSRSLLIDEVSTSNFGYSHSEALNDLPARNGKSRRPRFNDINRKQARGVDNGTLLVWPICQQSLAGIRGNKRIFLNFLVRQGSQRSIERRKRLAVDTRSTSVGEMKRTRNMDTLGKKYRRLKSIERNETLGGLEEDMRDDTRLGLGTKEGSKNKMSTFVVVHDSEHFLETRSQVQRKAKLQRWCKNEFKQAGVSDFSDDWTEEYIREPRTIEKKRTIEELELTKEMPLLCWSKKAKRRQRAVVQEKMGDRRETVPNGVRDMGFEATNLIADGEFEDISFHVGLDGDTDISSCDKSTPVILEEVDIGLNNTTAMTDETFDLEQVQTQQAIATTGNLGGCLEIAGGNSYDLVGQWAITDHASGVGSQLFQEAIGNQNLEHDDMAHGNWDGSTMVPTSVDIDICGDVAIPAASVPPMLANYSCQEVMGEGNGDFQRDKEIDQTVSACYVDKIEAGANNAVKLNLVGGRRCGLCGGGSDGDPPKHLIGNRTKHSEDNSVVGSGGLCFPESEWDVFPKEPGWLGRLLGPLSDCFGIAGIWVHQECAVWSPEVYFAGVGRLKNVRAALRRGRLLKCSCCGQSGATIGCRVDRCPRTYHLPCARFSGCLFDHKKYLMSCFEHMDSFLPRVRGNGHRRSGLAERLLFKEFFSKRKKEAESASQKDVEAEEKWLEVAGEDEEFARHEGRRLLRDLARIAPIFVGGSDEKHLSKGWESIGGLQNVVQCMKEMVILPLLYPEAFSKLRITPPRGVLLHGHPGTGKTLAVRALVGACSKGDRKIAYFPRKGADCLGKYAGDAERELRLLFQVAEQHQPSIIFFDEIDGLAPKRSQHQDQTQKSVVSTLLALMDGLKPRGTVIVIGATNRSDALDTALRRPGRFDREIYFPLPSTADRASILGVHTRKWETPPSSYTLSFVAQQTSGFAGADLQALCMQASLTALKRSLPLQDLLDNIGKGGANELPALPSLKVKLCDWVAALKNVPQPCSHRMKKATVNEVYSAPLPRHMVPALLWPMVELLVTLHHDARVILPPTLENAAVLMNVALKSSTNFCISDSLKDGILQEKTAVPYGTNLGSLGTSLEKCLEGALVAVGMISNVDATELFFSEKELSIPFSDKNWQVPQNGSGFRIMLSGDYVHGHDLLAGWILHGFEGFAEMRILSLLTMLQEGGGDVIQGLLNIFGEVTSICPCVVYMPQIETWAIENAEDSKEEIEILATQLWNLFMEQVNLLPVKLTVVFLASCGLPKHKLPEEIAIFFPGRQPNVADSPSSSNVSKTYPSFEIGRHRSNRSGGKLTWSSCCNFVPCSWIQLEASTGSEHVLDRAAHDYANLLSSRFLDVAYCSRRLLHASDVFSDRMVKTKPSKVSPKVKLLFEGSPSREGGGKSSEQTLKEQVHAEAPNSRRPQDIGNTNGNKEYNQLPLHEQFQISRAFKQAGDSKPSWDYTSGKSLGDDFHVVSSAEVCLSQWKALGIAITSCGYQLLQYPHLEELRHATSNLTTGPSIRIKKKLRSKSSASGDGSGGKMDQDCDFTVLNGLGAVGLLCYKGFYLTPRDVAFSVQKVLALLRKMVALKIRKGKDRVQFFRLLSQAAALEDQVLTWAYKLQSLEDTAKVAQLSIKGIGCEVTKPVVQSPDTSAKDVLVTGELECLPVCDEKGYAGNRPQPSIKDDCGQATTLAKTVSGYIGKYSLQSCLGLPHQCDLDVLRTCATSPSQDLHGNSAVEDLAHLAAHDKLNSAVSDEIQRHKPASASEELHAREKFVDEGVAKVSHASHCMQKCWKVCSECLCQVEYALKDLFYQSWRESGSINSLTIFNDAIGTSTSKILASLNLYDGLLCSIGRRENDMTVVSPEALFYECVKDHRTGSAVHNHSDLVNASCMKESMIGTQFWGDHERGIGIDGKYLCRGRARVCLAHKNEAFDDRILLPEHSSADKLEKRHLLKFACLCPLVRLISNIM